MQGVDVFEEFANWGGNDRFTDVGFNAYYRPKAELQAAGKQWLGRMCCRGSGFGPERTVAALPTSRPSPWPIIRKRPFG